MRWAIVSTKAIVANGYSLVPEHYLGPSKVQAAREVMVSLGQLKRAQKRLQAARRAHDQVKDLPDGQVKVQEDGG